MPVMRPRIAPSSAMASRAEFELLNDHLGLVLQRIPLAPVYIEVQVDSLATRRWNPRRKNMFRHHVAPHLRLRTPHGPERSPSRLPSDPVGERTWRRIELHRVRSHKIWLDHILRILTHRLSPAADFNIHFTERTGVIPREEREHGRRFQPRHIAHHKSV